MRGVGVVLCSARAFALSVILAIVVPANGGCCDFLKLAFGSVSLELATRGIGVSEHSPCAHKFPYSGRRCVFQKPLHTV
jgi:hypothetical protein